MFYHSAIITWPTFRFFILAWNTCILHIWSSSNKLVCFPSPLDSTGYSEEDHSYYRTRNRKWHRVERGERAGYWWVMRKIQKTYLVRLFRNENPFILHHAFFDYRSYPKHTRGWWDDHRPQHPVTEHPVFWILLAKTWWQVCMLDMFYFINKPKLYHIDRIIVLFTVFLFCFSVLLVITHLLQYIFQFAWCIICWV